MKASINNLQIDFPDAQAIENLPDNEKLKVEPKFDFDE